ncbi:MAG TPA: hypothetical protein VFH97_10185 [Gemmatimonadales bacterium]|nr:hypothetical protein [Gemmatimonadales bacterium]
MGLPLFLSACSHKPPPDFAPDPGLVARIDSIRMIVPAAACPGTTIPASYEAVLDDGSLVPFANRYDEDHPPPLHVVFLSRYSPAAIALENGSWATVDDPLASAMNGFPLQVILRAKPGVIARATVAPAYGCGEHAFHFEGVTGDRSEPGGRGPDVTVRLGLLSSPFVQRLIVAEIAVEAALPFYVLADADVVPPADWLLIGSDGGRGGRGSDGKPGRDGTNGTAGCPGTPGGAGGRGGDGADGGPGGPGGRVTVIVPDSDPFLAGLVDGRTQGGEGGQGGKGGKGGEGGKGGPAEGDARRCQAGADGRDGPDGRAGRQGPAGQPGPRAQVLTVPAGGVFGARPRPELEALIRYHEGTRG